ncbi:conserved hypothetical protein [Ricinus communis]|uniref:Uncharacterized protein n=1 Tax=Ricinus communis TaxID=3988 RepID=B9SH13_RICCO|nr:conserved hypothetical protein [Ricinus communis]
MLIHIRGRLISQTPTSILSSPPSGKLLENDAIPASKQENKKILNGHALSASIVADNGRATEYIKERVRRYEFGYIVICLISVLRINLDRERPLAVEKRGRKGGGDGGGGGRGGGERENRFEEN